MTDLKILFWDIENTPMLVWTYSLWPESIAPSMIEKNNSIMSFAARWGDRKKCEFYSTHHNGYDEMLKQMWGMLDEADALVSWNGASHDTKHANRAFIEAGMKPPSPVKEIDLLRVAKKNFKFSSNKLDHVAKQLNVGEKVDNGGFALWKACMDGDEKAWKIMRRYNIQDVNLLIDLYEKLRPWIRLPHPISNGGCINCGGDDLQRRGRALTLNGEYPRYVCLSCGKWQRGPEREAIGEMRNIS